MASRSESFFPASGCVPEQGEWISQCAAIWIRTAKMNVAGEHMGFVSDSHVHSLWRVGSKADTGYQALRHGHTPKAEKEPTMGSVSAAFYVKVLLLHNKSSGQEAHSALRKYGC